jgi:hypothetical protein
MAKKKTPRRKYDPAKAHHRSTGIKGKPAKKR